MRSCASDLDAVLPRHHDGNDPVEESASVVRLVEPEPRTGRYAMVRLAQGRGTCWRLAVISRPQIMFPGAKSAVYTKDCIPKITVLRSVAKTPRTVLDSPFKAF